MISSSPTRMLFSAAPDSLRRRRRTRLGAVSWSSGEEYLGDAQTLARRRLVKTAGVLLVPVALTLVLAYCAFGPLCQGLRTVFGLEALDCLSNDRGQFLQNFLGVIGILFSLLVGNTYSFCYNQQVMIYMAFFEEVSVAKALLEQVSLVCRGRPYYDLVLANIERYVATDLRRVDLPPAVVLSSKPKDDPLEQIMWMTSVGTPSVVYDTIKWLRAARGARLGAVQRKLPPLHFALLFTLALIELSAFPLLSAGAAETVGSAILVVESGIFALMVAAVVLTLGVVLQLWRPSGSAYSVDSALALMLQGLQAELDERKKGLAQDTAATNLPAPPDDDDKARSNNKANNNNDPAAAASFAAAAVSPRPRDNQGFPN